MALSRRNGQRFQASIWPGFVDAMTGLLLVLMFVLTIFMVVQSVLRETIIGQASDLDSLSSEVAELSRVLGLEQDRSATLDARIGTLSATLSSAYAQQEQQAALIASLTADNAAADARIASFAAQVASLRDEVSAEAEAARLAAAQRDVLEALAADLRAKAGQAETQLSAAQSELSDAEAARLAQTAAAEALRDKLKNSQTELSAMTLALEEQRRRAEETLTLLAAARKGGADLQTELTVLKQEQQQTMEERAALLSAARQTLSAQQAKTEAAERAEELLNQQVAALRDQLGQLQALLDDSKQRVAASHVEVQSLGQDLNAAVARAAAEEKRRREAEEEKNRLLEAQRQDLEKYRSDFFGRLRDVLGNQEGVRIEGDRFVFSSEVLFAQGQAVLSNSGKNELGKVAEILRNVVGDIPDGIDWIIRVDGHTDNVPVRSTAEFADNWELSQARALSVVRYMIDFLGLPPDRLAANGFGQYQPVAAGDSPEARAQNRRIELKFTER